jgi:hypothetical protein
VPTIVDRYRAALMCRSTVGQSARLAISRDVDPTDAATVATALFTAFAALAAWRSAAQARRLSDAAQRADLAPQVITDAAAGTIEMVIVNVGGGIAKGAGVILVASGRRVIRFIGDGFLRPGDKVHVHGEIPHDKNAPCVVAWLDADNTGWVVSREGRRKRIGHGHGCSRRRFKGFEASPHELWARVYGDDAVLVATVPLAHDAATVTVKAR